MTLRLTDPWVPIAPLITCGSLCRSPEHLRQVAAQFDVMESQRYAHRERTVFDKDGTARTVLDTFCNVYVWDVTRALACEIPHWRFGREFSANAVIDWLAGEGALYGWREVDSAAAELRAAAGFPAVVAHRNSDGPGHIAVVLPSTPGQGIRIAQAGRRNFFDESLAAGFGDVPVRYFTHQ